MIPQGVFVVVGENLNNLLQGRMGRVPAETRSATTTATTTTTTTNLIIDCDAVVVVNKIHRGLPLGRFLRVVLSNIER